ncbi:general substrate transporter [Umbelopsis sp. PMI_123]|nr:general substrate transporter [Umbelopsis sp. PMI_123]
MNKNTKLKGRQDEIQQQRSVPMTSLGVIGGVLGFASFQKHFNITPAESANLNGNVVSLLQVGCLVGALSANLFGDRFGRRLAVIGYSVIFIVGGALQAIGTDIGMLYAGRILAGFGIGANSCLVPIYIAEISPQNLRGKLGTLWQVFIVFGIAISYWINYACKRTIDSNNDLLWRLPLALQCLWAVLVIIGMIPLCETPRWLISHGHDDRARMALRFLRGDDAEEEFAEISEGLHAEASQGPVKWTDVISKQNRKRLFIGCCLQMFQILTGSNVINYVSSHYHGFNTFMRCNDIIVINANCFSSSSFRFAQYSPTIFKSIGLSGDESDLLATGLYGTLKVFVTLFTAFFITDRVGRRKPLIIGGIGMAICMFMVGAMVKVMPLQTPDATIGATSYVGVVFIFMFACVYSMSWGPVVWVYTSEIFPTNIRAQAGSLYTAINWAFNAIIGKVGPLLLASIVYGTYFLFGSFCIVMAIYTFFLVPETKGIMLEHMPELFKGSAITARKNLNSSDLEGIASEQFNGSNTSKSFEEERIERSAL